MTPTPKLRFVERVTSKSAVDGTVRTVRVLQQWWEDKVWFNHSTQQFNGEWRDVPVERE
jgi:hypothetical protein